MGIIYFSTLTAKLSLGSINRIKIICQFFEGWIVLLFGTFFLISLLAHFPFSYRFQIFYPFPIKPSSWHFYCLPFPSSVHQIVPQITSFHPKPAKLNCAIWPSLHFIISFPLPFLLPVPMPMSKPLFALTFFAHWSHIFCWLFLGVHCGLGPWVEVVLAGWS